ncbi:MAG: hypothetical protein LBV45_09325 [Xanthomonadaceae bacterium]|jgi:hypothetical protein|nr:hypothetical protein [Xanthomonadaceae bacterium]
MTVQDVTERDRHVYDAVPALMARQGFHVSMEAVVARVSDMQKHPAVWQEPAMRSACLRHGDPHYAADLPSSMIIGTDLERKRLPVPNQSKEQQHHQAKSVVDSFLHAFVSSLSPFPIEINRNFS